MALTIQRNISAPQRASGRAQGGGMRLSGQTLQKQQENVTAEGALLKTGLNLGIATVAGLNAGMSGQTTEDIGFLAAQGIETGSSPDASGFDVSKFADEAVATLGGVEGMVSGKFATADAGINIINNYQKGVSVGNAHAKQQGEAMITMAKTDADNSFTSDMASGNYEGSVERAYKAHVSALTKSMTDKNTTPAVKNNINEYLHNELAFAAFNQEYSTKQVGAIAKRNATTAKAKISSASDTGDLGFTQAEINNQRAIGALNMTDQEVEDVMTKTMINNVEINQADRNKTPNELHAYNDQIDKIEGLTAIEKEKLKRNGQQQVNVNKTEHRAFLASMSEDPQIEQLYADAVAEGYFDSKKEAALFKKKHVDQTALVDPTMPRKMNNSWVALRAKLEDGDTKGARDILYQTERAIKSQGSKEQDAYMQDQLKGMTGLVETYINAPVKTATGEYKVDNADLKKVFGETAGKGDIVDTFEDIKVTQNPEDYFFWKSTDDARTEQRKNNAASELMQMQATHESFLKQGKSFEAQTYRTKAKKEWLDKYMTPIFQSDFDIITRDKQEERNIIRGTESDRATVISSQLSRISEKATKIQEEIRLEKERKSRKLEGVNKGNDIFFSEYGYPAGYNPVNLGRF